ncbi:hypothetical protein [Tahibacter amnicola]|uniref:tRNA (guanine(46)-N(7))-methyltransferase n=1 Tax=Tahibacter amnicola TaxID=2976241 RepID=A0ABY6BFD8_9GAMM|nr:hypothetical protein [Tahibacter amnicola]UXI67075.1 hypothetical protein N4264_20330 [Tahibacter amnicola]
MRCDLVDFWTLAARAGWRFHCQYFLYPNPWPKPEQVQRRWHAHPILPAILACSRRTVLRTNWAIYAQEWAQTLQQLGWETNLHTIACTSPDEALTPFEQKYALSGHTLWQVAGTRRPGEAAAGGDHAP